MHFEGNFDYNSYMSGSSGKRVPKNKRRFVSTIIDKTIIDVTKKLKDDKISKMFELCFPNTLDTTVSYFKSDPKPDTFVITGGKNIKIYIIFRIRIFTSKIFYIIEFLIYI